MSMAAFGALSYAIVGVLYATLSVLLLTSWRGRDLGGCLIGATALSALWGITLAVSTSNPTVPALVVFSIEVLRGGAWLTFLVMLNRKIGVSRNIGYLAHAVWLGVLLAGLVLWFGRNNFGSLINLGTVLIPGGLAIALTGLVLIEQLYRNSPPESHWGIKALALGLGGLFAYDLFLYSQGVLFDAIDANTWMARGAVNILFVPLIALAARRNPDWDLDIFVSRQIVFYSTSMVAVGLYLLLMSLGGYALLLYGGTWGGLARMVFFAGAGLVLFMMLFSSTLRARFKVFLSKHFFRNKYDYREEWLRLIEALAGFEDRSTRQIVIKALAQIVDSPAGFLWVLADKEKAYQLAGTYHASDAAPNIPLNDRLVAFMKQEGWLIDLQEYVLEPKHYGDLQLPGWLSDIADAWLIVPLIARKELVGLIVLTKAPGPPKLNYEDRDLLKTVGSHIAVHLAQEKSDNLLSEARQFEAYNRLTAFLMHDLNNLIAQQSLIVENAEKHKRNPDFVDDAIETIAGSVGRMKRVMRQLKRDEKKRPTKATELRFIVSAAVDNCRANEPVPTLNLNGVNASLAVDAEQLTMVLTHLLRNAQDATPPDGSISVTMREYEGKVAIDITDTGSGMTAEFVRERLFRPFDSTKGAEGMGIGAYQAREFARKLGGDLSVESTPGEGTTVSMSLPIAASGP
jgi:putative PEP-CTERM system histidine kinase